MKALGAGVTYLSVFVLAAAIIAWLLFTLIGNLGNASLLVFVPAFAAGLGWADAVTGRYWGRARARQGSTIAAMLFGLAAIAAAINTLGRTAGAYTLIATLAGVATAIWLVRRSKPAT
jgi:hypothetical protein